MTRTKPARTPEKPAVPSPCCAIALCSLTARAQAQAQGEAFDVYEYQVLDNSVLLSRCVIERAV